MQTNFDQIHSSFSANYRRHLLNFQNENEFHTLVSRTRSIAVDLAQSTQLPKQRALRISKTKNRSFPFRVIQTLLNCNQFAVEQFMQRTNLFPTRAEFLVITYNLYGLTTVKLIRALCQPSRSLGYTITTENKKAKCNSKPNPSKNKIFKKDASAVETRIQ